MGSEIEYRKRRMREICVKELDWRDEELELHLWNCNLDMVNKQKWPTGQGITRDGSRELNHMRTGRESGRLH